MSVAEKAFAQTRVAATVTLMQYGFVGQKATLTVRDGSKMLGSREITFGPDGLLYVREEDTGTVVLVEASSAGYAEKGRFSQPDRAPEKAWPHPIIADGKLFLRDQDLLLCYLLK